MCFFFHFLVVIFNIFGLKGKSCFYRFFPVIEACVCVCVCNWRAGGWVSGWVRRQREGEECGGKIGRERGREGDLERGGRNRIVKMDETK